MNDFKTCGLDSAQAPLTVDAPGPYGLVINCKSVTFNLKELDIKLDKQCLDDIDTLIINGIAFVKRYSLWR